MVSFDSLKIKEEIRKEGVESTFFISCLPSNLAITLGNFFRRMTLDYISSVSLFAFRLSGKEGFVKTKFSNFSGLNKNVLNLSLQLKEIIFVKKEKIEKDEIFKFSISLKTENKEKEIKAEDFKTENKKIEIKNKELILGILSPDSVFELEIFCREEAGYFPSIKQQRILLPEENKENIIFLDTNYSPIKRVFPQEEKIVVSLLTEEEILKLDIETNGSITPHQALKECFETSFSLFEVIKNRL